MGRSSAKGSEERFREDYSSDGNAGEYFTHDHSRSRAYERGEDGLGGSGASMLERGYIPTASSLHADGPRAGGREGAGEVEEVLRPSGEF